MKSTKRTYLRSSHSQLLLPNHHRHAHLLIFLTGTLYLTSPPLILIDNSPNLKVLQAALPNSSNRNPIRTDPNTPTNLICTRMLRFLKLLPCTPPRSPPISNPYHYKHLMKIKSTTMYSRFLHNLNKSTHSKKSLRNTLNVPRIASCLAASSKNRVHAGLRLMICCLNWKQHRVRGSAEGVFREEGFKIDRMDGNDERVARTGLSSYHVRARQI